MKKQELHSPEVERLMRGRLPFVTRHGITIVALLMALVCAGLFRWGGLPGQLMKEIVEQTVQQIAKKMERGGDGTDGRGQN